MWSINAINRKLTNMKIRSTRHKWTDEEIGYLLSTEDSISTIAKNLNVSKQSVKTKLWHLTGTSS